MGKQALEKKLEALAALREAGNSAESRAALKKALRDANNFYVGKAAEVAAVLRAGELREDLAHAFDKFLAGGLEADPKCWAKISILRALGSLGHQDAAIYVKGFACVQMEPVWGGSVDAGAGVRAVCAIGLVESDRDPVEVLRLLTKGLADPEKIVRIETVRALARMGRWEGELLLRLKALHGDKEPEAIGTCYDAILELEQRGAVEFVAAFLESDVEMHSLEASAALAQSRFEEALPPIKMHWRRILTLDARKTIAIALGASPLSGARDFLIEILKEQSGEVAMCAVTGLASSRYRDEVRDRVRELVDEKRDRNLAQHFRTEFD